MKAMIVSGSYPPARCGVGDYVSFICKELVKLGVKVYVLTSSYLGTKKSDKNPVIIPEIKNWKISGIADALRLIKSTAPDIVHFQYPNLEYKKNLLFNVLPAALKIALPRIKIIQTFHEPLTELSVFGRLRLLVNMIFADALVFVEKENLLQMPWYMKITAAGKIKAHIPVASNIPRQRPDIKVHKMMRKKFGISPKKRIFMTFGFITPVKGYEMLLENLDFKDFEWIHLGAHDKNDDYQNAFMKKAAEKGVKIHFTGHLSPVMTAKYLASSGMCVFPFKEGVTDRHGTYLAAANQGVYCVAFHAQKRGFIKSENTYYAALNDINELINGMKKNKVKISHKPKLPKWNEIAKSHKELYETVIKGGKT